MDPTDSQFHEGLKKRVMSLEEQKKVLERCLESYTEAQEKKVDAKSEKQINMYIKEKGSSLAAFEKEKQKAEELYEAAVKRASDKRDKDIYVATKDYEKYRDYCNGHIERLGGSTEVPDPERIIRKKKELLEVSYEYSSIKRQLELWEIVNKPDYVHKVFLPEKTWVPSPELLAEEEKLKELRESWIPEPEY
jgi:hypothetical protein